MVKPIVVEDEAIQTLLHAPLFECLLRTVTVAASLCATWILTGAIDHPCQAMLASL